MSTKQESALYILIKVVLWPFKSFLRIFVVVAIVGLYIYQAVMIDELAGEIRKLEVKRRQLLNENSDIQARIDQLTNINRIEKLAKEKFGLVHSGNQVEYMVIKKYEPPQDSELKENVQLAGVK